MITPPSTISEYGLIVAVAAAKSLQSCPTLCDPTDGSPPGSPVPGILQARTLEWVAISFSSLLYIAICVHIQWVSQTSPFKKPHPPPPLRFKFTRAPSHFSRSPCKVLPPASVENAPCPLPRGAPSITPQVSHRRSGHGFLPPGPAPREASG